MKQIPNSNSYLQKSNDCVEFSLCKYSNWTESSTVEQNRNVLSLKKTIVKYNLFIQWEEFFMVKSSSNLKTLLVKSKLKIKKETTVDKSNQTFVKSIVMMKCPILFIKILKKNSKIG